MSGTIGIDPQSSATTVVVREQGGGVVRLGSVGDGYRLTVPNAASPDGAWGTAAALSRLAGTDLDTDRGAWRCDPWTGEFISGLRDRLFAYLGQVEPVPLNGYRTCVSVSADKRTPADRTIHDLFQAVGIPEVDTVDATDALVSRWLMETGGGSRDHDVGTVVAVVCGESSMSVATYQVRIGERVPHVAKLPSSCRSQPTGVGEWHQELAAEVLDRCRHGLAAIEWLSLLDGVLEFASIMRARPGPGPREWMGPLADRMFAPLRMSDREILRRDSVRAVRAAVQELVAAAASKPDLTLIGGVGAIWPFVTDALGSTGQMWRSGDPTHDLATGAACWPSVQTSFGDSRPAVAVRAEKAADQSAAGTSTAANATPVTTDDRPPWLRPGIR